MIDTERFNAKKLNEGHVKEKYQLTIRKKYAALENLDDSGGHGPILDRRPKFRPKRV
jgi:hypothetical protein